MLPPLDDDGYLKDFRQWTPEVAEALAAQEGIPLHEAHWEILHCLRDYYAAFEHAPAMRPLVKYVQQRLGPDKGRSIHLMQLFPGSPARRAARIAGLPKPDHCL